jgi:hypothetical protein
MRERLWSWAGCALAATALVVAACARPDGDPAADGTATVVTVSPSAAAAPVPSPSTDPADPPPPGYAEPCQRVAILAAEWVDLAVRIGEWENLDDIGRPELESLINRLTAVAPLLPADVQRLIPPLVDPLVQARGVLLAGQDGTIELGAGRDAVPQIFEGCSTYVPNYDDGPGGAGT